MNNTDLPYRPNVCMLLYNKDKNLFLGERIYNPGEWQFPQGGVDDNPSEEEAVIRELHEETGASSSLFAIKLKCKAVHEYEFYTKPKYAKNKWRGQTQTFWIVEFLGTDSDINLSRFHQEFKNFMWCEPDKIISKTPIYRYRGYKKPLEEFKEYLNV